MSWTLGRPFRRLLACCALLLAGHASAGTLLFSLSSPDDLSNLIVGQSAHFDVALSGLAAGEQLVTLTGGVTFNAPLLGAPTAIQPGAIVPSPLADPLDFQNVSGAGQADASFLTFSNLASAQVTSNGTFYGFDVKPLSAGSGTIQFNALALIGEQFDAANPNLPILRFIDIGGPLNFTIKASAGNGGSGGGGTVVPLPKALDALVTFALLVALARISVKRPIDRMA